jgi:HAD superfamily hydrolase (TIGR01509 family)
LALACEATYMRAMPHLRPFAAVVFDMDGTLLDTELVFKDIVWRVAGGIGFTMTDALHGQIVGSSHETTRRILVEAFGASFPYTMFDEQCRALMRARMEDAVPVKPGAPELLRDLKARRIPMAVATSSRAAHVLSQLGAAGLLDHFAAVVTRDDVTQPKPHPEPYLTAVRQLGVMPGAALAIEDSASGIRSAHAAGLQTVLVPDLIVPTAETRGFANAVFDDLHALRAAMFAGADQDLISST